MTYLFNQPSAFASELIEGFVAANADKVRQVPGAWCAAPAALRDVWRW